MVHALLCQCSLQEWGMSSHTVAIYFVHVLLWYADYTALLDDLGINPNGVLNNLEVFHGYLEFVSWRPFFFLLQFSYTRG